jgi:long-chain acyl-CoA synthetase
MGEGDLGYLFLPLSHTYGGIYNFIYSLLYGVGLYLCSDISLIAEELRIARPTIFCAVPRLLERFIGAARAAEHPGQALRLMFGGNLRYLFCSGGPWRPEDRAFYKDSGINLLEAYALTETASALSLSYSGEGETESVGVVLENIEVRIACPDENGCGEILVRGDNVFLGYYKDEEATKAAIDAEGFLHTGDVGRVDATGHLYLMGRLGRIFKTSAGEYVDPDSIERLLLSKPGVLAVSVAGKGGRVAAVLRLADPAPDIAGLIDEANRQLPAHMRVQEYSEVGQSEAGAGQNWKTAF